MKLPTRLAHNWARKTRATYSVTDNEPVHISKPKVEVPAHTVLLKASSARITHPRLEAILARYGQLSGLVITPSNKAALAMYIDQKAVDCLTAERNEILVRDANVQVESSLAIDDVTHSTRSDMLRLSRVPVSSGASLREVLDVLRPFNVTTVYMLRNRNLAYAKFDNQEGADKALAATWSKAGVSLRNNRIYGNYHPSGPPSYPQWSKLTV